MPNTPEKGNTIAQLLDHLVEEGLYFINDDGEVVQTPGAVVPMETVIYEAESGIHHLN